MPLQYLSADPVEEKPRFKPLNARTVRFDYFGDKALKYDEGRETEAKWNIENDAVGRCLDKIVGGTVVDIPCGTGRFFADYKERKIGAIGFDVSDDMLAQARINAGDIPVDFGDVMDIELDDRSVDAALCVRLLEKFGEADLSCALEQLGRVADKYLIFSLVVGEKYQRRNRCHVHPYDALREMVADIGFEIVDAVPVREPEYYIWFCKRVA